MKHSISLFHLSLIAALFGVSCKEKQISSETTAPPPAEPEWTSQQEEEFPTVNVSEYEAERLRQENEALQQKIEEQLATPVTETNSQPILEVTDYEKQRVAQENELLRKQLEEVQNEIARKAAEQERAAAEAAREAEIAQQEAENRALKQRMAQLESRLRTVQQTQQRITQPVAPIVQPQTQPQIVARPVSYQNAQYGTTPPPINDVSYFYEPLAQHGNWMHSPDYGYVWAPREGRNRGWHPYREGRWGKTNHGWTWMSEEPHGWATTHYGRWDRNSGLGWVWVPDTTWAPAWVSWRADNQYAGWAPLPPQSYRQQTFDHNVEARYQIPIENYLFAAYSALTRNDLKSHLIPSNQYGGFFPRTVNCTHIERRGNHHVHHHGLDPFLGGAQINLPRYNVAFDCPGPNHHQSHHLHNDPYHYGLHPDDRNRNNLVYRMHSPQAPRRSAPSNFTRLASTLFAGAAVAKIAKPTPKPKPTVQVPKLTAKPVPVTKPTPKPPAKPVTKAPPKPVAKVSAKPKAPTAKPSVPYNARNPINRVPAVQPKTAPKPPAKPVAKKPPTKATPKTTPKKTAKAPPVKIPPKPKNARAVPMYNALVAQLKDAQKKNDTKKIQAILQQLKRLK